ncbi:MAG: NAD(P)H-hydrate dehydratase [Lachnospiraceae bacterium]|nr:NAD(P)H-hydrate dehydratase [Lachnospiraceae bacterium]
MIPVVNGEQMRKLDEYTIQKMGMPSLVLMERAALAVADEVVKHQDCTRILVLCGSGNNGADGVAAARILHLRGYSVTVYLAGEREKFTDSMKRQCEIAENYHLKFVTNPWIREYTVVIDALFGVGLSRPVTGSLAELIGHMNQSQVPVVSVDIPSGISSGTGEVLGAGVCAVRTVTFAYGKAGLYLSQGQLHAGTVTVHDIGIYAPANSEKLFFMHQMEPADLAPLFRRNPGGNKGTFGKVLLIAGSGQMCGAAYLAGKACMRSGAGMLKIYTDARNRDPLLSKMPEAMFSTYSEGNINPAQLKKDIQWADVVGIGPGISTSEEARMLLHTLIQNCCKCCVMDADALTLLSKDPHLLEQITFPCVITPHIGELSRLTGLPASTLKKDLVHAALSYATENNILCVCKDARTVTVYPDGNCYINTSGCSGMATAGSGDVLTGMLLGQIAKSEGHCDLSVVPRTVFLHGLLGEHTAHKLSNAGMTASDMAELLPSLTLELEKM